MRKRTAKHKKPAWRPAKNPPAYKTAQGQLTDDLRDLFAELKNPKQRAFLVGYVRSCGTFAASQVSGVSRQAHYGWLRRDALYRKVFEQAQMIVADAVEEEVWRRAFEGYETPVLYRGKITDYYKTYSDTLAMFMLKKFRPEVYRDSADAPFEGPTHINITVRHRGKNGEPDPPPERFSYALPGSEALHE